MRHECFSSISPQKQEYLFLMGIKLPLIYQDHSSSLEVEIEQSTLKKMSLKKFLANETLKMGNTSKI